MKTRVLFITEIIAPYRTPGFNALASRAGIDLHVIYLSETDAAMRQWQVCRDEIQYSYEVLTSYRCRIGRFHGLLTRGTRSALERQNPQVVIAGGYNYHAVWQAQRWARTRHAPFLLWSESNVLDARQNFWWIEAAKQRFIRSCQGYVVPGKSAAAYLKSFGVEGEKIFVAPNAVDTDRFSSAAEATRRDSSMRGPLGLPPRYLLFVGRFVRAKGVFDLLDAYAKLPEETRRNVSLVLAGDGPEREKLMLRSSRIKPGTVVFTGFLQRDDLPAVYARAEAIVLPTHSDTWGLVVNEAIACGLPVIVTGVAGCVADLVRDGENGLVVDVRSPEALSTAMQNLATNPWLREQMSQHSLATSAGFTPQAWADGIVRAVQGVGVNVG